MQLIIDYGSVIAYVVLSIGVLAQTIKTYRRKSVDDISLIDIISRYLATFLLTLKILSTNDTYLITGQLIIAATMMVYLAFFIKYKLRKGE